MNKEKTLEKAGITSINCFINQLVDAEMERLEASQTEPEEVEPDEWDLSMISEAKRENDGTFVAIEDLAAELGVVL
ncbi:MAG: hypothetical protein IJ679_08125 [Lachnospiraceae bacterium]|nr:hypothetical protein [Lachnospiraceae bacterium]